MKKLLTILLLFVAAKASAQSVFELSMPDIKTGESILLKDHVTPNGLVVLFFSTKCPYVKYYEDRLADIVDEYAAKGISFIVVNANSTESKKLMAQQAEVIKAPYVTDKNKSLANALGAKKSPEVFVLNKNGQTYYSGGIDDNPQVATDVKTHYLKNALDSLLKGAEVKTAVTRPTGCMIR